MTGARFAPVRQARLAEAERYISDLLSTASRKLSGVRETGLDRRITPSLSRKSIPHFTL